MRRPKEETVDIETARNWAIAGSAVISTISIILVWVRAPGEKVQASIAQAIAKVESVRSEVMGKLDRAQAGAKEHDRRIQAVENELKHLPTGEEFADLQVAMARVEGDVKRIEEGVGTITRVVNRIDDHMRKDHR